MDAEEASTLSLLPVHSAMILHFWPRSRGTPNRKSTVEIGNTLTRFSLQISAFYFFACCHISLAQEMKYPIDVSVAKDGVIYIADRHLPGVWKVSDGKLATVFRASKKFGTPLNATRCVTLDSQGSILVGDSATRDIYRIDKDGKPVGLAKVKGGKGVGIGIPMDIVDDGKGNLYVTDLELHRVYRVASQGGKPEKFADVPAPRGLTLDSDGNLLVVSSSTNQLFRVSSDGKVESIVKKRLMKFPNDVVVGQDKTIYVSDGYSKAVWTVQANGQAEKWISGKPFNNPVGLAWRGKNLLVADPQAVAVFEVTPDGKISKLELKTTAAK